MVQQSASALWGARVVTSSCHFLGKVLRQENSVMYLPVQVHVRISPFFFLPNCSVNFAVDFTVTRGILVSSIPAPTYRKYATAAAVVNGGATSIPAVVNLRCIVEYGHAYSFVGSSTHLGMRVPGTWYLVPGSPFLINIYFARES